MHDPAASLVGSSLSWAREGAAGETLGALSARCGPALQMAAVRGLREMQPVTQGVVSTLRVTMENPTMFYGVRSEAALALAAVAGTQFNGAAACSWKHRLRRSAGLKTSSFAKTKTWLLASRIQGSVELEDNPLGAFSKPFRDLGPLQ